MLPLVSAFSYVIFELRRQLLEQKTEGFSAVTVKEKKGAQLVRLTKVKFEAPSEG